LHAFLGLNSGTLEFVDRRMACWAVASSVADFCVHDIHLFQGTAEIPFDIDDYSRGADQNIPAPACSDSTLASKE